MLTWPDLGAVANEIYRVSRQLLEEARRLETEDRPVRDFRRTDALPRLLILSDRLEVSFSDRLHVERRTIPLSQERGSVSSTRVEVDIEYHAIAEVRQRCSESGPFVAFHFATTWPRLDPGAASPEARVRAQRELRRLDTVLQNTWTARRSWNEQARTTNAWSVLPAVDDRNRVLAALWPHQLRTRRAIKEAQWRWRSGQTELQSHGLGPIVLSRTTTIDELCLKMALLTARCGALDEQELDPVLHGVQKYLRIVNREGAREIFNRAAMGYIGDMSPDSLRSYLRAIVRSLRASTGGHIAQIGNDGDRERFMQRGNRRPDTGAHEGREALKRREHIRLPGDEPGPHPWAADGAALLNRLAADFQIDVRVLRSWWRAGKITVRGCQRREERTVCGRLVEGTLEIVGSERRAFETLCATYLDKQERKRLLPEGAPAEKKRLYRAAWRDGGSRQHAAVAVRQRACAAGLPDLES